jgi:RNA polymerase sigma-70 factor (ECF subfamily)
MPDSDSKNLVARWRDGDQQAAAELYRRYASRLIALARGQLPGKLAGRIDPEDVVQSVYRTFFADAQEDRFSLQRGGDLWQLLVAITIHKVYDHLKWHRRAKRTVEREIRLGDDNRVQDHLVTHEPSPVEALALLDQVQQVMRGLDPLTRRILELRLQGHNLEEIAVATSRSQRSVIRALNAVKASLEQWYAETFGS